MKKSILALLCFAHSLPIVGAVQSSNNIKKEMPTTDTLKKGLY